MITIEKTETMSALQKAAVTSYNDLPEAHRAILPGLIAPQAIDKKAVSEQFDFIHALKALMEEHAVGLEITIPFDEATDGSLDDMMLSEMKINLNFDGNGRVTIPGNQLFPNDLEDVIEDLRSQLK